MQSLGQGTCSPDGGESHVPDGHRSGAGPPLWLVSQMSALARRDRLHFDLARIRFRCVGDRREPLFLQRGACIQMDRGHVVCDSGPYRFVRHPGYAGSIPPLFSIVFAIGTVWTLIPAAVATIITVVRTVLGRLDSTKRAAGL